MSGIDHDGTMWDIRFKQNKVLFAQPKQSYENSENY